MKTEKDMTESAWFSSDLPQASNVGDSPVPLAGSVEAIRSSYTTDNFILPEELIHMIVPPLDVKDLNMNARLPTIPDRKLTSVKKSDRASLPKRVIKAKSSVIPKSVENKPAEVVVRVVPTPEKKQRKKSKPETALPRNPKPLKVIRRRGKEEVKVFETGPKLIPDAMLDGVKPKSLEEIKRQEK